MGTRATLLSLTAAVPVAALICVQSALAQGEGCGSPLSSMPVDHAGETPVFNGIDHDNRAFTLTQDPETGAWALWVISEFTEQSGGVSVGTPCVVVAGSESKMLSATAAGVAELPASTEPTEEVAAVTEPVTEAETFRVTQIADGEVLDLRTGAGTDFPSIAAMPAGASGIAVGSCKTVDGYRFPWCEATWQGTQGWASACCLESEGTGRRLD